MGWDGTLGQASTVMEWNRMEQKNMSHEQAWKF